jgi:8-oxo-dGTP diphosphatase
VLTVRNIVNALFIRQQKVLLARRSPLRKAYPDLWSFPGGHVEERESFADALQRELQEEIGVTPIEFKCIRFIFDPNTTADDPATYHMYIVTVWQGGEPQILDDEHSELRWFTPLEAMSLPDLALDEYRDLLQELADDIIHRTSTYSRRPPSKPFS